MTVRDFTQVFDAFAQFEESMVSAKMETTTEFGPTEEGVKTFVLKMLFLATVEGLAKLCWRHIITSSSIKIRTIIM